MTILEEEATWFGGLVVHRLVVGGWVDGLGGCLVDVSVGGCVAGWAVASLMAGLAI